VIVLVAGTGTDVGKTWVTAATAVGLRGRKRSVRAHKPAQSFAPADPHTDADLLAAATGQRPEAVCPPVRWFALPMAPPMAADAPNRPRFTIAELVAELRPTTPTSCSWKVPAVCAPARRRRRHRDPCRPCAAIVVLVADAGLGTISGAARGSPPRRSS
jgi:dethiobiotin synthetase